MEERIAVLARTQHGVVALSQLVALGLSKSGVARRVDSRRLRRLWRGVYAVGPLRLTRKGQWIAAVLACGPQAKLSFASAAALAGLQRGDGRTIHVTVPDDRGRGLKGVTVHRARLDPHDTTTVDGIPTTTVTRTLIDLATTSPRRFLESNVETAERLGVLDAGAIRRQAKGRRGAATLMDILDRYDPLIALTFEGLEREILRLCRIHHLPAPKVNAPIDLPSGRIRVDFLWDEQRVVLEGDSYEFHHTTRAMDDDRRRDQELLLLGYTPIRTTWHQVTRRPHELATTLSALLSAARPTMVR